MKAKRTSFAPLKRAFKAHAPDSCWFANTDAHSSVYHAAYRIGAYWAFVYSDTETFSDGKPVTCYRAAYFGPGLSGMRGVGGMDWNAPRSKEQATADIHSLAEPLGHGEFAPIVDAGVREKLFTLAAEQGDAGRALYAHYNPSSDCILGFEGRPAEVDCEGAEACERLAALGLDGAAIDVALAMLAAS